jgi:hypothetical protein
MSRAVPWWTALFILGVVAPAALTYPPVLAEPAGEKPAVRQDKSPLTPPAGHVFLFELRAEGVQIYECQAGNKTGEFQWVLQAPDAVLYDDRGEKAGTHGAGPTWTANDGSKLSAVKAAAVPAPGGRAVAWLLLRVEGRSGNGVFSPVTYIQRVDTWAGQPPDSASADRVGTRVRVKYEATYRFFGPAGK